MCNRTLEPWHWEDEPTLKTWDPASFCALLGNRSLLFAGDSTMKQTATTIMNSVFPAGCQTQMTFFPADTLVGRKLGHYNRGHKWTYWVDTLQPDVVMINAGAHIRAGAHDDTSFDQMFDDVLRDILLYRKSDPHRIILWSTQNRSRMEATRYLDRCGTTMKPF